MEGKMHKSLVMIGAALAAVASGSFTAQAGSSTSAPSRYNGGSGVQVSENSTHHRSHATDYPITEFSSSSAKSTAPKR
jgi:hypothetical protein